MELNSLSEVTLLLLRSLEESGNGGAEGVRGNLGHFFDEYDLPRCVRNAEVHEGRFPISVTRNRNSFKNRFGREYSQGNWKKSRGEVQSGCCRHESSTTKPQESKQKGNNKYSKHRLSSPLSTANNTTRSHLQRPSRRTGRGNSLSDLGGHRSRPHHHPA